MLRNTLSVYYTVRLFTVVTVCEICDESSTTNTFVYFVDLLRKYQVIVRDFDSWNYLSI